MNMTVNDLAAEIKRQQAMKKDFLARSWDGFQMDPDGTHLEIEGLCSCRLRDYAHGDLSAFTEIPKPYYDRMRRDQPTLLATNVNHWLEAKQSEQRLIRTLAGETRAVLSNKFRPLDHSDLIQAALPALYEHPSIEIRKCELTERKLYLTAILPKLQFEVRVGDIVQFGLSISNSEIGQGALEVALYCLRLRCLNGMVLPDNKTRKNHIGGRLGDDLAAEYFADDTRKLADQAFFLKLRDTTRHMLTQGAMEQSAEQMRRSAGIKLEARPDKAVKEVSKRMGLSETEGQSVLEFLLQGGDMTMWGMANAITATARVDEDADRADELERHGRQADQPGSGRVGPGGQRRLINPLRRLRLSGKWQFTKGERRVTGTDRTTQPASRRGRRCGAQDRPI